MPQLHAADTLEYAHAEATVRHRWLRFDAVADDFAAYSICCGVSVPLALDAFMLSRVQYRNRFESADAFQSHVANTLQDARQPSADQRLHRPLCKSFVTFNQRDVCVSCYTVLLGVSRSTVYEWMQKSIRGSTSRRNRPQGKTHLARAFILEQVHSMGQHMPNPKNKKVNHQMVIMPFHTQSAFYKHLLRETRSESGYRRPSDFSRSTMIRALNRLKRKDHMTISCRKSKSMGRCDDCDSLENKRATAVSAKDRRFAADQLTMHLRVVKAQRDWFEKQKMHAREHPELSWCITFDGMDQAKTRLPSRIRYSKSLEARPRLGVHAVGAFCFGAPVPVIGICNFPDLIKDSSLSITVLERILDMQFKKLTDIHAKDKDGNTIPPVEFQWPRSIHLVFDNTSAEAKNQYMWYFLGLLVKRGVFDYITVSTLMVGHTHDIVDQMFSVWAKILRVNNAHTWDQMRSLFSEKYHSKVVAIVKLIREGECELLANKDAEDDRPDHDAYRSADWSEGVANLLEELATDLGVAPAIELQEFSINFKQWYKTNNLAKIEGSTKPHCFGVEKDEDGKVWLYNKHLADSDSMDHTVRHHYPGKKSGNWTTRCQLYDATRPVVAGEIAIDDSITNVFCTMPADHVDTDSLRGTMDAYLAAHAITDIEYESYNKIFDGFDSKQSNDDQCPDCKEYLAEIASVGVLHRPKPDASDAEKKAYNEGSKKKANNRMKLLKHLSSTPDLHPWMWRREWFEKWITRVESHILPVYVKHGWATNPLTREQLSVHPHPSRLVSSANEPPTWLECPPNERVDISWFKVHGPLKVNDFVIVRGGMHWYEPIWIGQVLKIHPSGTTEASLGSLKEDLQRSNNQADCSESPIEDESTPTSSSELPLSALTSEEREHDMEGIYTPSIVDSDASASQHRGLKRKSATSIPVPGVGREATTRAVKRLKQSSMPMEPSSNQRTLRSTLAPTSHQSLVTIDERSELNSDADMPDSSDRSGSEYCEEEDLDLEQREEDELSLEEDSTDGNTDDDDEPLSAFIPVTSMHQTSAEEGTIAAASSQPRQMRQYAHLHTHACACIYMRTHVHAPARTQACTCAHTCRHVLPRAFTLVAHMNFTLIHLLFCLVSTAGTESNLAEESECHAICDTPITVHWFEFTKNSNITWKLDSSESWITKGMVIETEIALKRLRKQYKSTAKDNPSQGNDTPLAADKDDNAPLQVIGQATSEAAAVFQKLQSMDTHIRPAWLLDGWRGVRYESMPAESRTASNHLGFVQPGSLILWGRRDKLMTTQNVLTQSVFDRVKLDLTECNKTKRRNKPPSTTIDTSNSKRSAQSHSRQKKNKSASASGSSKTGSKKRKRTSEN